MLDIAGNERHAIRIEIGRGRGITTRPRAEGIRMEIGMRKKREESAQMRDARELITSEYARWKSHTERGANNANIAFMW